jgi:tRNA(adenine34) deaminase
VIKEFLPNYIAPLKRYEGIMLTLSILPGMITLISAFDISILEGMNDKELMEICLEEAMLASEENEVPIGALIISHDNMILSRTHNQTRAANRPTAHAEVLAIEDASCKSGNFRLNNCTLFVTKEPCIMCAGAILESRIKRVVFGCFDVKRGAFGSLIDVNALPLNHKVEILGGVSSEKSKTLLKRFFQQRRGTEVAITGPTRNRLYA